MTARRFLMAGSAAITLGALVATAAAAQSTPLSDQSVTTDVVFRGGVAAACLLNTPTSPTASNATVSGLGPGTADISINQLVDESGTSQGAVIVLVLPAVCNQAHTLRLLSQNGGLLSDGPEVTAGPFRSQLPYQVTVAWGDSQQTFQSVNQALEVAFAEALTGSVTITIQIPAGGDPLAAGAYVDELIFVLGAAG